MFLDCRLVVSNGMVLICMSEVEVLIVFEIDVCFVMKVDVFVVGIIFGVRIILFKVIIFDWI